MTELNTSLPETPRTTDTDSGYSRRFSTGRPSSSSIGEKVLPIYLRASTGSCHDLCKYGGKHEFEEKARPPPPWLRKNAKKPPDEENSSNFQPEENMVLKVKHKPNSNPKVPPKSLEVKKGEVSAMSLNRRTAVSSSGMAANKMLSRVLLTKSVDRQNPVLSEVLAKKKTAGRELLTESIDSQKLGSSENQFERNALATERKQTGVRKVLTKSVDSQSSISGDFERRKADALERKKADALERKKALTVPEQKRTTTRKLLTKSVDNQSSTSGEFERRKADAPERKKVSAVPEQKQTTARKLLTKSVDSQSSTSGELERRKADALERKKASAAAVKLRASLDSATRLSPKTIKQDTSSSSSGRLKVSLKQVSTKVIKENVSAKDASSSKLRLSLPNSSSVSSGGRNGDSTTGKKIVTSKLAAKRLHISPRASLCPKSSSSGIVKGQANPKASLSLKPTLKVQLSSRALLSPKTSSTGIARAVASPRSSMSSKSLGRLPSLNKRYQKGSEVLQDQSKIEKGKNEHPKTKQADPDQFTEELEGRNNDTAEEKTLYVIKMETGNKVLESEHNENLSAELSSPPLLSAKSPSLPESSMSSSHNEDEEESEYTYTEADTGDEFVSEYDETESVEEAHPLEGERKKWHRKAGLRHLEDKSDEPFKLRFRQGRVIDIQPEHNTPRRLKFRQGRGIGENQTFKSEGRRSFKRRAEGHANDSKPNSEKVVLRHQDAQGKKDAQGLFNNVIEETASKLAETRKSKVKALVGAFETVISLQDKRPSGNTVS